MEDRNVKRGDIYHADLDPVFGSEQGGYRPVLVIQNNIGNKYSPMKSLDSYIPEPILCMGKSG